MMAHIEVLPTINVLRLCNRFGHGRFSDFPVELVHTIEESFVEQVHGRVTEELAVASRCFKNKCSILDHADRGRLLKMDATYATSSCRWMDFPDDPNDEQLVEALEEIHDDDTKKRKHTSGTGPIGRSSSREFFPKATVERSRDALAWTSSTPSSVSPTMEAFPTHSA